MSPWMESFGIAMASLFVSLKKFGDNQMSTRTFRLESRVSKHFKWKRVTAKPHGERRKHDKFGVRFSSLHEVESVCVGSIAANDSEFRIIADDGEPVCSPANFDSVWEYISSSLTGMQSYLAEYERRLMEFHYKVEFLGQETNVGHSRHPDHDYAARYSGVTSDGSMQIRIRMDIWNKFWAQVPERKRPSYVPWELRGFMSNAVRNDALVDVVCKRIKCGRHHAVEFIRNYFSGAE